MAEKQYRRLTRPHRRRSGFVAVTYVRSSLWLGNDHLLQVDSNGYVETYKRFYFQDIQALTLRLTQRRLIWNWALGVPTFCCLVVSISEFQFRPGSGLPWTIAGMVFTLLFGIPLLLNNLLGSTCACTLRTAVQAEELPSLCRLPRTRRILDLLRPLIAQAQGQLTPEEISARFRASQEPQVATETTSAAEAGYVVDDPNAPPRIVS